MKCIMEDFRNEVSDWLNLIEFLHALKHFLYQQKPYVQTIQSYIAKRNTYDGANIHYPAFWSC